MATFWDPSDSALNARGWQNEYLRWQEDQAKRALGQSAEAFDRSNLATNKYEMDLYDQYGKGTGFLDTPYADWRNTQQGLIGDWSNIGNQMNQRVSRLNPASQAAQAATARSYAPAYASAAARMRNVNPADPQYGAALGRIDQARARGMDENLANRTAQWVNTANQTAKDVFGTGAGLKQGLAEGGINQAMGRYGVQNQLLDKVNQFGQQQNQRGMGFNQMGRGWGNDSMEQAQRNYAMEMSDAGWGKRLLANLGIAGLMNKPGAGGGAPAPRGGYGTGGWENIPGFSGQLPGGGGGGGGFDWSQLAKLAMMGVGI